jgi:MFS family permease
MIIKLYRRNPGSVLLTNQVSVSSSSTKGKKSRIFYGYIIILASFFILLICWGAQYSFGVFLKPVLNEFGWTRAVTSGAYSLNMVLVGVFCLISGKLVSKLGPRIVLTAGGCFIGLGYILMSKVASEWQYYLCYGIIISIGVGCVLVPLLATVARWFTKGRGLASGIVISGVGIGIVVMPQIANAIISNYNWRTSFLVLGIVSLVLIISFAQLLKGAPERSNQDTKNNSGVNIRTKGLSLAEAAHTRAFWIVCLNSVFLGLVAQVVMVHIVAHTTDIGFAAVTAATVLAVEGFTTIFGKIIMGGLSDRIGNRNVMIIMCILYILAFIWIRYASDLWMLYVFAVLFGLGYSGGAATHSPQVAEFFGLRSHGVIFGLAQLIANVGGAFGSLIAGYIFDISGSYQPAFLLCVIMSVIGLILSAFLPAFKKARVEIPAKSSA